MGDPGKSRRAYKGPRHPWEGWRIEAERPIKKDYGFLHSLIDVSIQGDIAYITLSDENVRRGNEALMMYQKGIKESQKGFYREAIKLFQKTKIL
ncbi:MAG: hypothetical protein UU15_C0004G0016, partial [Candidatus Levybacteria bacterium GW2011_GWC2_40_7]